MTCAGAEFVIVCTWRRQKGGVVGSEAQEGGRAREGGRKAAAVPRGEEEGARRGVRGEHG